jgi:hypothetical protein
MEMFKLSPVTADRMDTSVFVVFFSFHGFDFSFTFDSYMHPPYGVDVGVYREKQKTKNLRFGLKEKNSATGPVDGDVLKCRI